MSKNNDWKERLNIVYSTNPDFDYQTDDAEEQETLPAENNRCASNSTSATATAEQPHSSRDSSARTTT